MKNRQQSLRQALKLTELMQDKAETGQWQAVIELEKQRDAVLAGVLPLPEAEVTSTVQTLLRALIDSNAAVESQAREQKQAVLQQLNTLSANKHAIAHYTTE